MSGTLKFFVEVRLPHKRGELSGLKMVYAINCDEDQCDKRTVEFVALNKHLPVVRATWTAYPKEVSLNFTRK